MSVETTYTNLRQDLSSVLDRVCDDQEVVIVRRRNHRDVALIPADELESIIETAHLLRSPANAKRLLRALHRADARKTPPFDGGRTSARAWTCPERLNDLLPSSSSFVRTFGIGSGPTRKSLSAS